MMANLLAMLVRLATGVRSGKVDGWTGHPSVFFANHSSNLDALVIWAALPREIRTRTSPVAARDYWQKTALRRWLAGNLFHAIYLSRTGRTDQRSHPMEGIFRHLQQGRSIIIFPEGTRSLDGSLKAFKSGLFRIRQEFPRCPMIPVSLQNLNRILPKGHRLPIPIIGRITVHPPLADLPGETRADFLARARAAVASEIPINPYDE